MILAEMSETVWLALIGVLTLTVKQILDWASMWVKLRVDEKRAEEVKRALDEANRKIERTTAEQKQHLNKQDEKLEVVVRQTNGLIDEIKEKARKEGHESGEKAALTRLGIEPRRASDEP